MMKLLGYMPMKQKKGKVLFVSETPERQSALVGQSCDKVFVYDELSEKITEKSIGHDINVLYDRGYSGKAYVADIVVN